MPYLRGGIVEHGGSGHPITEALYTPPGREHSARMARVGPSRPMVGFTMQGEDLPQPTNRVDLDPAVRDVWGLPVGRITYSSHAVDVACAHHWGPRLEAVLTEAGAHSTAWLTSPGDSGNDGAGPATRSPATGWARRGWVTTRASSVCDPWQRLWDVDNVLDHRLVGVPDVDGLRADADAGRARASAPSRAALAASL